jgi:hypothetical protein
MNMTVVSPERMYLYLGIGWIALRLLRNFGSRLFIVLCAAAAILGVFGDTVHFIFPAEELVGADPYWLLGGLFFAGATFRLLQRKIVVSKSIAIVMIAALMASGLNPFLFGIVYRVTVAYLVVYLALVPAFRGHHFSPGGDYSYGIYIYAFPVQQAVATFIRGFLPIK